MKLKIRCRFRPAALSEALLPRIHPDIRIVALQNSEFRGSPRGLNIDATMIFDMLADGCVQAVEIICHANHELPRLGQAFDYRAAYHKMYIDTDQAEIGMDYAPFTYQRSDRFLQFSFGAEVTGVSPLLGPGVRAVLQDNHLVGLRLDVR